MIGRKGDSVIARKPYEKWRMYSLIGIHVLFLSHFIHWKLAGQTLAPLELNEVLYTIHQGILTAGFILMAVIMVGTLIFGRFFCSWGCHILALQDLSAALLEKLHIRPITIRSRTLIWMPMLVMFYMFIWPQILSAIHGVPEHELRVVTTESGGWASFITDSPWRNLPPVEVALFTFFIVGFLIVFLLGSRAFCFMGCPYGALFGIADQFAPGRIALTGNCTDCGICTSVCSSDIMVHKEVQLHEMVTNPRCLKDLDCISVCPEEALSFAFRKPPMFQKGHPLGRYSERKSLTVKEDLLVFVVFIFSVFTFRGLYDTIPLLLSVGMAICTAMIVLLFYRAVQSSSFALRGLPFRSSGKWTSYGIAFNVFCCLLVVFVLHSSAVQIMSYQATSEFKELNLAIANDRTVSDKKDQIRNVISKYETLLQFGLAQPIDRKKELANLHLLNGNTESGTRLLKEVLEKDPTHIEVGFRLAEMYEKQGDKSKAIATLESIVSAGEMKPHTDDANLLAKTHLNLGKHYLSSNKEADAKRHLNSAIELSPTLIEPRIILGHIAYKSGNNAEAQTQFEQSLALGGKTPVVLNNLAAIHAMAGRNQQAIDLLTALAELAPTDPGPPYRIGLLAMAKGDLYTARTNLEKAKQLNPQDPAIDRALKKLDTLMLEKQPVFSHKE